MSNNLMVAEVDCETGIQIERPMTEAEIAIHAAIQADMDARSAAQEAEDKTKADAKAAAVAKLTALGLTADEVAAIF